MGMGLDMGKMGSGSGRPRAAASPASAVAAKAAKARDGWGARCRRPLHTTTILSGQRDSQSWMETFFLRRQQTRPDQAQRRVDWMQMGKGGWYCVGGRRTGHVGIHPGHRAQGFQGSGGFQSWAGID